MTLYNRTRSNQTGPVIGSVLVDQYVTQSAIAPRDYIYRMFWVGTQLVYTLRIARHVVSATTATASTRRHGNNSVAVFRTEAPYVVLLRPDKEMAYTNMQQSTQHFSQFINGCQHMIRQFSIDTCCIDVRLDDYGTMVFDGMDLRPDPVNVAEQGAQHMYRLSQPIQWSASFARHVTETSGKDAVAAV